MNSPVLIHLIFTMAGCDASTPPDSEDDASMLQLGGQHQPENLTHNEMEGNGEDDNDQPDLDEPGGRQKAHASFKQLRHPPELIVNLCGPLKKSNVRVVENLRCHFDIPLGMLLPIRIKSEELRVGMERAAAKSQGHSTRYTSSQQDMIFLKLQLVNCCSLLAM